MFVIRFGIEVLKKFILGGIKNGFIFHLKKKWDVKISFQSFLGYQTALGVYGKYKFGTTILDRHQVGTLIVWSSGI
jgi:hypothetical protein